MKRWLLVLLGFELVLFALILILPQVDLPDFTFGGGVGSALHGSCSDCLTSLLFFSWL